MLLATRNVGKVADLRRLLAAYPVRVVGTGEVEPYADVAETGATFTANALLKARAGVAATGLLSVADDSGLCVDALGGMPGILSARWSGGLVSGRSVDEANLALVLAQLADVDYRDAAFVCVAAAAAPGGTEVSVVGTVRGTVLREPRGSGGFGYDPIFRPHGSARTTAEMSPEEKDLVSHRGRAFRALAPRLIGLLGLS